jgi:hypothetical protein
MNRLCVLSFSKVFFRKIVSVQIREILMVKREKRLICILLLSAIYLSIGFSTDTGSSNGYPSVSRFIQGEPDTGTLTGGIYTLPPYAMQFSGACIPQSISGDGNIFVRSLEVEVSKMGSPDSYLPYSSTGSTTSLQTSFFFRGGGRIMIGKSSDTLGMLESYSEAVKESPRLTQYFRFVFSQDGYFRFKYKFLIPRAYGHIVLRGHKGIEEYSINNLPSKSSTSWEFQSMSFISPNDSIGFALAFFPMMTESRHWNADDYQVTQTPRSYFKLIAENDGISAEVWSDSVKGAEGETFDQYFTLISLHRHDFNAENYFSKVIESYNSRYFPVEGFSNKGSSQKNGFGTIHDQGYSWGFSTWGMGYGKNLRNLGNDTIHGICRDELIRHFIYYNQHMSLYGLLPFTIIPDYLVVQTKEKERIPSDFMFGQGGAEDVDFASKIIPTLPSNERGEMFKRVSRLKILFDPAEPMSWTRQLPSGEYWFEYSNLWKSEGYLNYIINTHVTALRIAIHMKDLAHKMGAEEDEAFWGQIVQKGTDGMLWFVNDPNNWGVSTSGHRELVYKKGAKPGHVYYQFIVDDLTYLLDSGLLTYRAAEVRAAITGKE